MVRITTLMSAFLVSLASWTSTSAQEGDWTRCVPKVVQGERVRFAAVDSTDHPGPAVGLPRGEHGGLIFFFPKCQYFSDCTTACFVESVPSVYEDPIDLAIAHDKKADFQNGSGSGGKGVSVSCTGAAAMAVESCPLGLCNIDLQWTVGGTGVTFKNDHLWSWGHAHTHTCAPPTRATGGPGGGRRGPDPNRCQPCGSARVCGPWHEVCPGKADEDGEDCGDWEQTCVDIGRMCCPLGALPDASSEEMEPLCGDWMETAMCEPGSTCCIDPQQFPSGPTCASAGLFAESEEAQCAESCGASCEPASIVEREGDSVTRCWQCTRQDTTCSVPAFTASATTARVGEGISFTADASSIQESPPPQWDLGNGVFLAGSSVSYAYPEPGAYSVLLTASDAVCGSVQVSPPQTITVSQGTPSCGALGGDYCSQTGGCPGGYASLGNSWDCNTCCKYEPLPSCGALGGDYCSQAGSCPAGYTPLGASSDCSLCCKYVPPPSCGAMGGDYCSQAGSCPADYTSLGASSDCSPCCKYVPPPSCGAMGGDYCSQSESCPEGYGPLGASSDCAQCCRQ